MRTRAARAESRHREPGEAHHQPEARPDVAADVVEQRRVDRAGRPAALAEQVLALVAVVELVARGARPEMHAVHEALALEGLEDPVDRAEIRGGEAPVE